jgi:hypothetical protein
MDHLPFFSYPEGQIQAGMKLAPGALAAGLAASAVHGDEAAAEQGLVVKDLGETGPGPPFGVRQVASGAHWEYLLSYADIIYYIRYEWRCQAFF